MLKILSTTALRLPLCALPLVLSWNLATAPAYAQATTALASTQSQTQNDQTFSQAQIQQLVAPIALYPDALLTQVLMASTYPLEVVEAARWSRDNPTMKGPALETAMQAQSWDPSIKALTSVPQTLQMMNDKLNWTQQLGDAFLAQQQSVLDAVQTLRAEAQAAGNLQSTPQQVVTTAPSPAGQIDTGVQQPIVIEPVNPDVYYVPVYNPAIVYGAWDYPAYQPFYWSPPGFVASNVVSFAAGIAVGAAIWGNCDWWHHSVIINVNRYNVFNHTNINITNNVWVHNPAHRGNVPYRNAAVAERFGRGNEAAARNAFRDNPNVERTDPLRDRSVVQPDDGSRDRADAQRERAPLGQVDPQRPDLRRLDGQDEATKAAEDRMNADLRRPGEDHRIDDGAFTDRPRREDGDNVMQDRRMPSSHPERRTDGGFHEDFGFRRH
jgi:Protein of unknown function (DUF3300)